MRLLIATVRTGHSFDGMPSTTFQLNNHLGSVNFRLSDTGSILDREEYYPFGDSSVRTWANGSKRFRYVGKEKDAESQLYYYGARYYSAWTCRFISVDPLARDYPQLTSFNYSANEPIGDLDIDGMQNTKTPKQGSNNNLTGTGYTPSGSDSTPVSRLQTSGYNEHVDFVLHEVVIEAKRPTPSTTTGSGTQIALVGAPSTSLIIETAVEEVAKNVGKSLLGTVGVIAIVILFLLYSNPLNSHPDTIEFHEKMRNYDYGPSNLHDYVEEPTSEPDKEPETQPKTDPAPTPVLPKSLSDDTYLYRAMRPASDGLPEVPTPGEKIVGRQLGARKSDIEPILINENEVTPIPGSKGGLSTSIVKKDEIRPTFASPIENNIQNKGWVVYRIKYKDILAAGLVGFPEAGSPYHILVQPPTTMSIPVYQSLILTTRNKWQPVN